jgi:hypothetical protein
VKALKRTLVACDEPSGFVDARGLLRPPDLEGLTPTSVRTKLTQPSFAAGVHRDEVLARADEPGLELDERIATVVAALQPITSDPGLPAGGAGAWRGGRPGTRALCLAPGARSSVDRALASGARSRRFESCRAHY